MYRERMERIADAGSSSLHSSSASMMIKVGMRVILNGPMMSVSSWEQRESLPISGLAANTGRSSLLNCGYRYASWKARVGKMFRMLLLSSESREQKKLAPSFPSEKLVSARVWAMVDLPVPARPFSQKTRWSPSSVSQLSICHRTSFLVPLRQPCLSPERYPAPATWCISLRRVRSDDSYPLLTDHERGANG